MTSSFFSFQEISQNIRNQFNKKKKEKDAECTNERPSSLLGRFERFNTCKESERKKHLACCIRVVRVLIENLLLREKAKSNLLTPKPKNKQLKMRKARKKMPIGGFSHLKDLVSLVLVRKKVRPANLARSGRFKVEIEYRRGGKGS